MRQSEGNPSSNRLQAGVTEEALMNAVKRSGYPMQAAVVTTVVDALDGWDLPGGVGWTAAQEEWTYRDGDTGKTRALDALIESHLWLGMSTTQPRIRPVLSLLIECKQSELPYVFFTREATRLPDYPITSGFPHDHIELTTDDDPSTWSYALTALWGLQRHDFILLPRTAVSVSSARRNGKSLEVSGEDTYNGLALPLLKATEHLRGVTNFEGKHYTDGRLIISLVVMRAPMVAVAEDGSSGAEHVPWVRVHRYEPAAEANAWQSHRLAAFDIVHEDFLPTYLETLRAYAEQFASACMRCQKPLLSGRGFAEGLGHGHEPLDIEPRTAETRAIAGRLTVESIRELVLRRSKPFGVYVRPPLREQRGRSRRPSD